MPLNAFRSVINLFSEWNAESHACIDSAKTYDFLGNSSQTFTGAAHKATFAAVALDKS